jgi:hypothetical protein
MKIQLNKIQQGPVLAKGTDSAGNSCGLNGTNVGDGCVKVTGNLQPSATVTYSQPCSC